MRPKSPFLQNLRKRTPSPQMTSKEGQSVSPSSHRPSSIPSQQRVQQEQPQGFIPFNQMFNQQSQFAEFSTEQDSESEEEVVEQQIDLEKERRVAYEQGYQKAKSEMLHYQQEALRLEKGFQEILQNMELARQGWISEVRVGVAECLEESLKHIAQHDKLQSAILGQKLSEALSVLADEKELVVFVDPRQVDFAKQYLSGQENWTVRSSQNLGGGAILESESGVWDARLQVTLDEISDLIGTWLIDTKSED